MCNIDIFVCVCDIDICVCVCDIDIFVCASDIDIFHMLYLWAIIVLVVSWIKVLCTALTEIHVCTQLLVYYVYKVVILTFSVRCWSRSLYRAVSCCINKSLIFSVTELGGDNCKKEKKHDYNKAISITKQYTSHLNWQWQCCHENITSDNIILLRTTRQCTWQSSHEKILPVNIILLNLQTKWYRQCTWFYAKYNSSYQNSI